jgi:hypothetical protein
MAAIDQIRVSGVAVDEHAARRTLRDQISRLERELSALAISAYPRLETRLHAPSLDRRDRGFRPPGEHPQGNLAPWASVPPHGNLAPWASVPRPRVLSLGELERVRDAIAARLGDLRAAAAAQSARQADAARELERMLADPPAHKWQRITQADLGIPGCGDYHVRPKAGLLGMLMGWWVVKMSSGCP